MTGLKNAVEISNERLKQHMKKSGYKPMCHTLALWKHTSRYIVFTLVLDDSGV